MRLSRALAEFLLPAKSRPDRRRDLACAPRGLVILLGLVAWNARAEPIRPDFYYGARASAMGNAFTAVADDHDAVFYNPAGLVHQRNLEFELLNPKLEISSDDLTSVSKLKSFSSGLDASKLSGLFGKEFYGGYTAFPSVYLPGFVMGGYASSHYGMIARNLTMPQIALDSITDYGVVSGFAFETRGFTKRQYLRLGADVKWLQRTGFDSTIPYADLISANTAYFKSLSTGPATGIGGGLGMQYEIPTSRLDDLTLGSAWQDIGDTRFGSSTSSGYLPSIQNNLSAGFAYTHKFSRNRKSEDLIRFSAEGRHLLQSNVSPLLKTHAGTELKIKWFSFMAGLSQDGFTGGTTFQFGPIDLALVTYSVETQTLPFQGRERFYALQLHLFGLDFGEIGKGSVMEEDRRKYPRTFK